VVYIGSISNPTNPKLPNSCNALITDGFVSLDNLAIKPAAACLHVANGVLRFRYCSNLGLLDLVTMYSNCNPNSKTSKSNIHLSISAGILFSSLGFDIDPMYTTEVNWFDIFDILDDIYTSVELCDSHRIMIPYTNTVELLRKFRNIADQEIESRDGLDYQIDGLVVTIVDKDIQTILGRSGHINNYQIAFKFPEENGKTTIIDYTITTGDLGYKEMMFDLDPVILNGTTQTKGKCNGVNGFNDLQPMIGDEVMLQLSGDVIPVMYVTDDCARGHTIIEAPTHCDEETCNTELIIQNSTWRCPNIECKYRVLGRLDLFLGEMNAKGIGRATTTKFYDELYVRTPSDMLKLTYEQILSMSSTGETGATNIINELKTIINKPHLLEVIISSAGIDELRALSVRKILKHANYPDEFLDAIKEKDEHELHEYMINAGYNKRCNTYTYGLIYYSEEISELLNMLKIKNAVVTTGPVVLLSGLTVNDTLQDIAIKYNLQLKTSGTVYDMLLIKDDKYRTKKKAQHAMDTGRHIITLEEYMNTSVLEDTINNYLY